MMTIHKQSKRLTILYTATLILLILIAEAATIPARASDTPVTVIDDLGRTVEIPEEPKRIVSTATSITETLFAIGVGDKVVGVSKFYPPEVSDRVSKGLITVIGSSTNPSLEKIVALNPDLVFGHNLLSPDIVKKLEDLGIPVVIVKIAESMEGVFEDIMLIGKACWASERAKALVSEIRGKISLFERALKGVEKVKVAYVFWVKPVFVAGNRTYVHDLMERAGGRNVFSDKAGWASISEEELANVDPPRIIVPYRHGGELIYEGLMKMKEEGVIHGELYPIDSMNPDLIARPGPRIVVAYELIVKFLHPEVWSRVVKVEDLIVPESVEIGKAITIFVKAKNPGEVDGEKVVNVTVDGEALRKSVTLKAGESKLVEFLIPAKEEKNYTVKAGDMVRLCKVIPGTATLLSSFERSITEQLEGLKTHVDESLSKVRSDVLTTSEDVSELKDSISTVSMISTVSITVSIMSLIAVIVLAVLVARRH